VFDDSLYIRNTIEADTEVTRSEEGALIELFKKQRPGEPPSVDNARALLNQLFFDPSATTSRASVATSSTRA
jgi:DNA-directed RNA polymerase subunit beta